MSRRCCCGVNCEFVQEFCDFIENWYDLIYVGMRDTDLNHNYDQVTHPSGRGPCEPEFPVGQMDFYDCEDPIDHEEPGVSVKLFYSGPGTFYLQQPDEDDWCQVLEEIEIEQTIIRLKPSGWELEILADRRSPNGPIFQKLIAIIPLTGTPCWDNPKVYGPVRFYDAETDPLEETHIEVKIGFRLNPYPVPEP